MPGGGKIAIYGSIYMVFVGVQWVALAFFNIDAKASPAIALLILLINIPLIFLAAKLAHRV